MFCLLFIHTVVSSILKCCITSLIHQIQLASSPCEKIFLCPTKNFATSRQISGEIFIISLAIIRRGWTTVLKTSDRVQKNGVPVGEKCGAYSQRACQRGTFSMSNIFFKPHQVTCEGNYGTLLFGGPHSCAPHLDLCVWTMLSQYGKK